MTPSAKLGTRIAVGATIAGAVILVTATVPTRASGAAKVTTVAGSVAPGAAGDGGVASSAALSGPKGVAVDAAGDIAIADTGNCRVRFVAKSDGTRFGVAMRAGHMYTVAGSACGPAAANDEGPALRARLSFPSDVAFAPGGYLDVADTGNNMVRVISPQGGIATRAGTGHAGYSHDTGLGKAADLDGPEGIAVDARGNVYIADTNNCRVREVPTAAGISGLAPIAGDIYTIAGDGPCGAAANVANAIGTVSFPGTTEATLRLPGDVAVDAAGNVFVADTGNRVVREIPIAAGTNYGVSMQAFGMYTVAGAGTYNVYFGDGLPAASDASSIGFPSSIALDGAGNLFIADTYARAVREVPAVAGTSFGVAVQPAAVFTIAGAGPTGSPTAGGTSHDDVVYPAGIAADATGNIIVADIGNNTIERLTP